jgi:glutathione S-transferase
MRNAVLPAIDRVTNRLASAVRLRNGSAFALRSGPEPPNPILELYEYEASPFCRRVRETLCVLELPALIKPCPRETLRREGAFSPAARYKPEIVPRGGRLLFPFLVDHTSSVQLNESGAICDYLWKTYGGDVIQRPASDGWLNSMANTDGARASSKDSSSSSSSSRGDASSSTSASSSDLAPASMLRRAIDFALLALPSALRPWPSAGLMMASASKPADEPLILHGTEHCEGSRVVRERLCELQLCYHHIPCETHPNRPLPHLEDPSTGFRAFGAAHALQYLEDTYRQGPTLDFFAPVPRPNLGDADRTSWLTHALGMFPERLIQRARQ